MVRAPEGEASGEAGLCLGPVARMVKRSAQGGSSLDVGCGTKLRRARWGFWAVVAPVCFLLHGTLPVMYMKLLVCFLLFSQLSGLLQSTPPPHFRKSSLSEALPLWAMFGAGAFDNVC